MKNCPDSPRMISIYGNPHQDAYVPQIAILLHTLHEHGFEIYIHPMFHTYLSEHSDHMPDYYTSADAPPHKCEAVLSIGGDGTFLRTAQWVEDREIPILGINTGHLGYLSLCEIEEYESITQHLYDRSLLTERRTMLKITSDALPHDLWPYALNEVAILKQDTSSMISVSTMVDGNYLTDYLGDGLLVSTPTGSTGYNLSVGGPILRPTLDAWVLSPIAPHSLTMRPLVIDSNATISAQTSSRANTCRISLDGRSFSIPCGNIITISKAPFSTLIMRRKDDNFASTLRHKLLWGTR